MTSAAAEEVAPPLIPAAAGAGSAAVDSLEELHAAVVGRLTGHLAHELRNVLTGVRCYLELLNGVEMPPEVGGFLGEILGGLDRMTDLTSMWHDVARGRAATACLNVEVSRLVQLLRAAGLGRRIRFSETLDPKLVLVEVEPTALEAALLALLCEVIDGEPEAVELFTTVFERGAEGAANGCAELRIEALRCRHLPQHPVDLDRLGVALGARPRRLTTPQSGFELRLPIAPTALAG